MRGLLVAVAALVWLPTAPAALKNIRMYRPTLTTPVMGEDTPRYALLPLAHRPPHPRAAARCCPPAAPRLLGALMTC